MNICFMKCEVIKEVIFNFIIEDKLRRISISEIYVKESNGNITKCIAYNEIADKLYKELELGSRIIIIGRILNLNRETCIEIKDYKIIKNMK